MVGAGKATSVEAALDALARGDHNENALGMRKHYDDSYEDPWEVLVQVLRALRLNLEHQHRRVASLETDVRVLRAHLPESWPTGRAQPWWRRMLRWR